MLSAALWAGGVGQAYAEAPQTPKTRTTSYVYYGMETGDAEVLQGLLKRVDGPRTDVADVTRHEYYTDATDEHRPRYLKATYNALGQRVIGDTRYDRAGRLVHYRDANDVVHEMVYHVRGWLLSSTAAGITTTYDYDASGQLERVTLGDGATLDYAYDDADRLWRVTDALGARVEYTFDTAGRQTGETVFDAAGEVVSTQSQDFPAFREEKARVGADGELAAHVQRDGLERVHRTTDGLGRATTNAYDALGRLTGTRLETADTATSPLDPPSPDAVLSSLGYDAFDNLTTFTDANGNETRYVYDALGNLLELDSPDTSLTEYAYDAAGNLVWMRDSRGLVDGAGVAPETTYTYDALNRLLTIDYDQTPESPDVRYVWDAGSDGISTPADHLVGRLAAREDESGTTQFRYSAQGQLAEQRVTTDIADTAGADGTAVSVGPIETAVGYAYDDAGRLAAMTYPSGRKVEYHRDANGQVQRVELDDHDSLRTLADDITYRPFESTPVQVRFGTTPALYESRAVHDVPGGVPKAIGLQDASTLDDLGTTLRLDLTEYGYTPGSAYSQIASLASPLDAAADTTYRYDLQDRLTAAEQLNGYGTRGYGYDANGNRTSLDDHASVRTWDIDPLGNALEASALDGGVGDDYLLDDSGRTLEDPLRRHRYTWAANGRLREVRDLDTDALIATYHYADGRERIAKTVDGVTTLFHYDAAGQLIAESDVEGNVIREYVFLDNRLLAIIDAAADAATAPVPVVATEHVVDSDDADATSRTGTWSVATDRRKFYSEVPHGADSLVGQPGASFRWTPDVAAAGDYAVYAYWTYHVNHASAVDYTVTHADGADTLTVAHNVPSQAGRWRLLGTYRFAAGTTGHVDLTSAAGTFSADAIRLEPVDIAGTIIVDDRDNALTTVTGSWLASSGPDPYDGRSLYGNAASARYRWSPVLESAGRYRVYAHWTHRSNRAADVPYRIAHNDGIDTVTMNQHEQGNGGRWHLLGTYDLDPANAPYVEVSAENGQASADAVKFVPVAPAPTATPDTTASPTNPPAASTETTVYFVRTDHLDTPTLVVDDSGDIVWQAIERLPFGEVTDEGPGIIEMNVRFPGQYLDRETGLHYNYWRFYDASVGRYVRSDPIGLDGGANTFGYVGGNPLASTDRTGLYMDQDCLFLLSNAPECQPLEGGWRSGGGSTLGGGSAPAFHNLIQACKTAVKSVLGAIGIGVSGEACATEPQCGDEDDWCREKQAKLNAERNQLLNFMALEQAQGFPDAETNIAINNAILRFNIKVESHNRLCPAYPVLKLRTLHSQGAF